jgi:predicted outer membrane lipoprotein
LSAAAFGILRAALVEMTSIVAKRAKKRGIILRAMFVFYLSRLFTE